MGDEQAQPGTELEELQREAERKYWDLRATLEELDRVRARAKAQHASPEERRRSFRVIQGGAAVVGVAAAWVWETARRPALAVAVGSGAMVTSLAVAPSVSPGIAAEPPPTVVESVQDVPSKTPRPATPTPSPEPVAEEPTPSAVATVPEAPVREPFTPMPTQTVKPKPTPTPTPSVTATADAEVEDLVEIEVNADSDETCVESTLTGLELAVCLDGVGK